MLKSINDDSSFLGQEAVMLPMREEVQPSKNRSRYLVEFYNLVPALLANGLEALEILDVLISSELNLSLHHSEHNCHTHRFIHLLMMSVSVDEWSNYYLQFLRTYGKFLDSKSTYRVQVEHIVNQWNQKILSDGKNRPWALDILTNDLDPFSINQGLEVFYDDVSLHSAVNLILENFERTVFNNNHNDLLDDLQKLQDDVDSHRLSLNLDLFTRCLMSDSYFLAAGIDLIKENLGKQSDYHRRVTLIFNKWSEAFLSVFHKFTVPGVEFKSVYYRLKYPRTGLSVLDLALLTSMSITHELRSITVYDDIELFLNINKILKSNGYNFLGSVVKNPFLDDLRSAQQSNPICPVKLSNLASNSAFDGLCNDILMQIFSALHNPQSDTDLRRLTLTCKSLFLFRDELMYRKMLRPITIMSIGAHHTWRSFDSCQQFRLESLGICNSGDIIGADDDQFYIWSAKTYLLINLIKPKKNIKFLHAIILPNSDILIVSELIRSEEYKRYRFIVYGFTSSYNGKVHRKYSDCLFFDDPCGLKYLQTKSKHHHMLTIGWLAQIKKLRITWDDGQTKCIHVNIFDPTNKLSSFSRDGEVIDFPKENLPYKIVIQLPDGRILGYCERVHYKKPFLNYFVLYHSQEYLQAMKRNKQVKRSDISTNHRQIDPRMIENNEVTPVSHEIIDPTLTIIKAKHHQKLNRTIQIWAKRAISLFERCNRCQFTKQSKLIKEMQNPSATSNPTRNLHAFLTQSTSIFKFYHEAPKELNDTCFDIYLVATICNDVNAGELLDSTVLDPNNPNWKHKIKRLISFMEGRNYLRKLVIDSLSHKLSEQKDLEVGLIFYKDELSHSFENELEEEKPLMLISDENDDQPMSEDSLINDLEALFEKEKPKVELADECTLFFNY
ncbi:MAG: F-box protein [Gammaproteobacteria bacterium]|nr:F-box protein [Gammaproteobacteria bacterium]